MQGIDAAFDLSPYTATLQRAGIGWAGRYYSRNPNKDLSPREAQALAAAGIALVSVFEAQGDRVASFTAAQGALDAQVALACAAECGQPAGSTIYFAVDFDAGEAEIAQHVVPYFQAIAGALVGKYVVGAYGSGLVLSRLQARGLAQRLWLAQAGGWAHGSLAVPDIKQGPVSAAVIPGHEVDTDESLSDTFGAWGPAAAARPGDGEIVATVKVLQGQLQARGFYKARLDGIAGPQTLAALAAWEHAG